MPQNCTSAVGKTVMSNKQCPVMGDCESGATYIYSFTSHSSLILHIRIFKKKKKHNNHLKCKILESVYVPIWNYLCLCSAPSLGKD